MVSIISYVHDNSYIVNHRLSATLLVHDLPLFHIKGVEACSRLISLSAPLAVCDRN